MHYSENCRDLTTRWDRSTSKCILCEFAPGHEVTPNCGYDDDGGRHESPLSPCKNNTFNNGSWAYCRLCSSCSSGHVRACNRTTDAICRETSEETASPDGTVGSTSSTQMTATARHLTSPEVLWAVPLAVISIMLVVLFVIYIKRKKGQATVLSYERRLSYINAGFSALSAVASRDVEDSLDPVILSAPLQTVLDNLDVLEEMMILLDPEVHGVKNTKHLASHCSFTSTWITYTYSMKESKSPLKAVLEGVTSRQPDWTVGHLAKILRDMERNDAVAVLSKLQVNQLDV